MLTGSLKTTEEKKIERHQRYLLCPLILPGGGYGEAAEHAHVLKKNKQMLYYTISPEGDTQQ